MRKRRRLANKMTIMVCAVLLAVSAFFYVPMEVDASVTYTDTVSSSGSYRRFSLNDNSYIYLADYIDSEVGFYKISMDITTLFSSDVSMWLNNFYTNLNCCGLYQQIGVPSSGGYVTNYTTTEKRIFYLDLSDGRDFSKLSVNYKFVGGFSSKPSSFTVNCSYSVSNVVVEEISSVDYDSYEQGYNAGYSAGETAGYGNGYAQGFADGEASVDTDAIYDEAFQAGKDSVDTQSYYDAGYQAGYQVAYSEGYESGYDSGYQDAMDRIANWGADTSDYPILVYKKNLSDVSCEMEVVTNMPSVGHGQVNLCNLDISINPSHTYKIVFDSVYPSTSVGDLAGSMNEQFNYNIGLFSIPWSSGESYGFVQGSSLSSVFRLEVYDYSAHYYEIGGENDVFQPWEGYRIYNFDTIDVFVYDMGPSGDTQNHIANQTDQLTNGYDTSSGDSSNSSLSTGLNEFETAENSLFATATTGMKDFTFFDFESVPAMLTAVTFITSIMGSWFEQAGGASGVGIVLSILFSVMLVSMVLGLYRLYQSAGHRAEARERHRERMEQWKRGK